MGKKVKIKVKKGKAKIKLKSGDDVLPLSEANVRGLLVLAMASAVGPGAFPGIAGALAGSETVGSPSVLTSGEPAERDRTVPGD